MPSLIDLRRRIRSVKNMQQITRAMKMVSASRLRRAQERIEEARPYALELQKVTRNLSQQSSGSEAAHPLLESRPVERVLIVSVSGDKGLCGGFNSNVLRLSDGAIAEHGAEKSYDVLCLGKRASDHYSRRKAPIRAEYRSLFRALSYEDAQGIASDVAEAFIAGEYDAVYVVYNQFVSVMTQRPTVEQLLPLEPPADDESDAEEQSVGLDYLYEPSSAALLAELLPRFVTFQVYRVLLESQAAEHAARMTAMDAATKNAGELMEKLTLIMNRKRQAAITTELIEVVSGAAALEN